MNRSILRGMTLLETAAKFGRPLTLKELAAAAKLNNITAYRLVISLEAKGLICRLPDTGLLSLGPACLYFADAFRRQGALREKVVPSLQALMRATEETVGYTERFRGDMCVTLERWESPHETRTVSQIGIPRSLCIGSSGPAILAMLPDDEIASIIRGKQLAQHTPFTPTTEKQSLKKVALIRRKGYAVSLQEKSLYTAGVAASVFSNGSVVGSLAIIGPVERMKRRGIDHLGILVRKIAHNLSKDLDYTKLTDRKRERLKRIV